MKLNQFKIKAHVKEGRSYGNPTPTEVEAAFHRLNELMSQQTTTVQDADDATECLFVLMGHAAKVNADVKEDDKPKRTRKNRDVS